LQWWLFLRVLDAEMLLNLTERSMAHSSSDPAKLL
jgi:hypothetical protein